MRYSKKVQTWKEILDRFFSGKKWNRLGWGWVVGKKTCEKREEHPQKTNPALFG